MLRMEDEIGTLRPGLVADISVLDLLDGRFELADNSGVKVTAQQMFMPALIVRAGQCFDCTSPLIPMPQEVVA